MVRVELRCTQEDRLVAEITTEGELSAKAIHSGLESVDRKRMPARNKIQDGMAMTCQSCGGPLYFHAADGDVVAMPGLGVAHG